MAEGSESRFDFEKRQGEETEAAAGAEGDLTVRVMKGRAEVATVTRH